jgi:hypothetical protein
MNPPPDRPELPEVNLPSDDEEALRALASAAGDAVRPVVVTPPEERWPPLAPAITDEDTAPARRDETAAHDWRNIVIGTLALIGIVLVLAWTAVVWQDPQSPLNPLAPATPFIVVTATPPGP